MNLIADLKSADMAFLGAPTNGGLLDPTIGVRYSGIQPMKGWNIVIEAAAKLALQGQRDFLSTGKSDFGVQATLQRFGEHHAWYVSASGVYYDGSTNITPTDPQIVPTLVVGYERKLSAETHLILQGYISDSIYSHEDTDLHELLDRKYQLSAGVYHRFGRSVMSFAITENLQNFNNTPDVGLQLGWAYSPALAHQAEQELSQAGWTFAFRRNRFVGSYFFLISRRRGEVALVVVVEHAPAPSSAISFM